MTRVSSFASENQRTRVSSLASEYQRRKGTKDSLDPRTWGEVADLSEMLQAAEDAIQAVTSERDELLREKEEAQWGLASEGGDGIESVCREPSTASAPSRYPRPSEANSVHFGEMRRLSARIAALEAADRLSSLSGVVDPVSNLPSAANNLKVPEPEQLVKELESQLLMMRSIHAHKTQRWENLLQAKEARIRALEREVCELRGGFGGSEGIGLTASDSVGPEMEAPRSITRVDLPAGEVCAAPVPEVARGTLRGSDDELEHFRRRAAALGCCPEATATLLACPLESDAAAGNGVGRSCGLSATGLLASTLDPGTGPRTPATAFVGVSPGNEDELLGAPSQQAVPVTGATCRDLWGRPAAVSAAA
eukprot:TRINITY_DN16929_c0_g4_i2.p1 TRINITY_DN16929_c0_g4~~TRINITY_DN16929_c0_g4_i2.p1  ORF type:complete len:409 (+),score=73.45 TRINITY_DN16929_c0_g4_i2:134-1228(+)